MQVLLLLPMAFLSMAVLAQTVEVKDAWIRGTLGAQQATGAFMLLTSKASARLVAAASPAARTAEIHSMKVENNVMRMFPVAAIDLPAGQTVRLAPGGYHLMLTGLPKPLSAGEKVRLQLSFELAGGKQETVDLLVEVRDVKGEPVRPHHRH